MIFDWTIIPILSTASTTATVSTTAAAGDHTFPVPTTDFMHFPHSSLVHEHDALDQEAQSGK